MMTELEPRLNPGTFPGPMVLDLDDVPQFASLPGANHTIYLDFNGHVTTGTNWNGTKYGTEIVTRVYSTDGAPATYSIDEQITIRTVYESVAEDFAPFAVNVTTIAPPESDLIRSDLSDPRWGVRVAIGGAYSDWYGAYNSGVAFTTSFRWTETNDTTAFVFSETLNSNAYWMAQTTSHEAGHSLGLSHDGAPGAPYYQGHGTGATGWATIMGASFYKPVTQWDNGTFPGALNLQDDLAIITTQNGFGYRPDDYPVPTLLGVDVTRGIIERNTDVDTFIFKPEWSGDKPGSKQIPTRILVESSTYANLDVKATLYGPAGNVIWDSSPIDSLNVDISIVLRAGFAYTLHVSGDGSLNYTNYGSLGQYTVTVVTP